MAADWLFDLPLTPADRELVLARLRTMLGNVPNSSSSVRVVVGELLTQVEEQATQIRLHMAGLDKFGLLHLSNLLASLDPPGGRTRCPRCSGAGDVPVPAAAAGLATALDSRYSLTQLLPAERAEHLDWPADEPERQRILAASKAEAARRAEAQRKSEERSRLRVLPGELAPGQPVYESPGQVAEFMPGRSR